MHKHRAHESIQSQRLQLDRVLHKRRYEAASRSTHFRFSHRIASQNNFLCFVDWLDVLTAAIFVVILIVVLCSSLYDRILRNTISLDAERHYKSPLVLLHHRAFTLFSLRRNWFILSAPTKPEHRDLRFIQAVRVLTTFGVIIGHCGWFSIILPSYNPIFIEDVSAQRCSHQ